MYRAGSAADRRWLPRSAPTARHAQLVPVVAQGLRLPPPSPARGPRWCPAPLNLPEVPQEVIGVPVGAGRYPSPGGCLGQDLHEACRVAGEVAQIVQVLRAAAGVHGSQPYRRPVTDSGSSQRTPRGRNWMLIRGPTYLVVLGTECSQVRWHDPPITSRSPWPRTWRVVPPRPPPRGRRSSARGAPTEMMATSVSCQDPRPMVSPCQATESRPSR